MSFAHVDASADPAALAAYLDRHACGPMAGVKARLLAMLEVRPGERVLDVGCGTGHDLELLARAGAVPVGVDASAEMAVRSRARCAAVVQADASRLPFPAGSFDGCRIERVLLHVADPAGVAAEVHRVLRSGGRLVVFEPVWASLSIDSAEPAVSRAVVRAVAEGISQPLIGHQAASLLAGAGFTEVTRVDEPGEFATWAELRRTIDLDKAVGRALSRAKLSAEAAARWRAEMHSRSADGSFHATLTRTFLTARA
ncbi:methyltransferase domain-containing protein [Planomonospora sp. ID67723]|uniref:methyltransferase domain-containing protein n=1 Tax=Planomonospora sp. ID67723 TaxID=2738134 RepID=UPI0018C3D675|nr:methyltransferase domain-containing protein [Planomonospora sp. ID67723]MBG0831401.1 methyltransferase domain-containing protein [Planomonospora sp. ID67723]